MKYYSSKSVTKILGVTAQTLRNWDKEGKLKPAYIKSNGYRYYSEDSILSYTQERKTKKDLNVIGYARVSSKKQSDDLERQERGIYNEAGVSQQQFNSDNCETTISGTYQNILSEDLKIQISVSPKNNKPVTILSTTLLA